MFFFSCFTRSVHRENNRYLIVNFLTDTVMHSVIQRFSLLAPAAMSEKKRLPFAGYVMDSCKTEGLFI